MFCSCCIHAIQPGFTGVADPDLITLRNAADRRQRQAYRPGTRANHRCQVASFINFCTNHNLQFLNPSVDTLCVYTEYLAQKFSSPTSVKNYLSAVKLLHNLLGLQAPSLDSFQYRMMLRALPLTMRHVPTQRQPITPTLLGQICRVCDYLSVPGLVLKVAFLLSFFGFLRQSNLAPPSTRRFDRSRHTTRSDITVQPPGLLVHLKWTKTLQHGRHPSVIPIPALPGSPLDPVAAFIQMISAVPGAKASDPLLSLPHGRWLTIRHLQQGLRAILEALGQPAASFSLHSLRRGGATASFQSGASTTDIQRHGTWQSNAFESYVTPDPADSRIAQILASMFADQWQPQDSCHRDHHHPFRTGHCPKDNARHPGAVYVFMLTVTQCCPIRSRSIISMDMPSALTFSLFQDCIILPIADLWRYLH